MAITIGTPTGSNSLSYSHTIPSGTEVLVVGVCVQVGGGNASPSVTVNGLGMTNSANGNGNRAISVFTYIKPPTGSQTIAISHAGSLSDVYSYAITVDEDTGKELEIGDDTVNLATSSVVVTATASEGVVFDSFAANSAASAGAGQTQVASYTGAFFHYRGSREAHSGADVTMSWSVSGGIAAVEIKPKDTFAPRIAIF